MLEGIIFGPVLLEQLLWQDCNGTEHLFDAKQTVAM